MRIEELFVIVRKSNETEIKGEKQLEDLTDSVKFMSYEFHEYEKERLERLERLFLVKHKQWDFFGS